MDIGKLAIPLNFIVFECHRKEWFVQYIRLIKGIYLIHCELYLATIKVKYKTWFTEFVVVKLIDILFCKFYE